MNFIYADHWTFCEGKQISEGIPPVLAHIS